MHTHMYRGESCRVDISIDVYTYSCTYISVHAHGLFGYALILHLSLPGRPLPRPDEEEIISSIISLAFSLASSLPLIWTSVSCSPSWVR